MTFVIVWSGEYFAGSRSPVQRAIAATLMQSLTVTKLQQIFALLYDFTLQRSINSATVGGFLTVTVKLRLIGAAAFIASRHDHGIKAYRQKLDAAGKPFKVAIIACARRLLTQINAIIRDNRTYRPETA